MNSHPASIPPIPQRPVSLYQSRLYCEALTGEHLDAAVLRAAGELKPEWGPADDVFCPTEYWEDCGSLVDVFEVDVGRDTSGWMAYCEFNVDEGINGASAREAICRAIVMRWLMNWRIK